MAINPEQDQIWVPASAGYFTGPQFGIIPNGLTTDYAPLIQRAINAASAVGGRVVLPAGTFPVSRSVALLPGVSIEGSDWNPNGTVGLGTIIQGAAGIDIFTFPTTGIQSGFQLRNLHIKGGARQLVSLSLASFVVLEHVVFDGPSSSGIYIEGGIEEWYARDLFFQGGQYGFRIANVPVGSNDQFDKSFFAGITCSGQLINCVRLEVGTSNSVTFENLTMNFCQQSGFYGDSAFASLLFINPNTESNGLSGPTSHTTGSITSGTNSLAVADGTGFINGQTIVVAGAGSFKDLVTTITSGANGAGAQTFILGANAGNTVTNARVTNALYDDFTFNNTVATPQSVTFVNGVIALNANIRYAVKYDLGNRINCYGLETGSPPVYALDQATVIGGATALRQVNAVGQTTGRDQLFAPSTTQEFPWTWIASPPGADIKVFQRDSLDNGTGTFGAVDFRRRDGSTTLLIDSAGDIVQNLGSAGFFANGTINAQKQIFPATPAQARQTACALWAGTGAPANANGANGDIYLRSDGGALTTIYQKRVGAWVGII